MAPDPAPARRAKHLIDPTAPPVRRTAADERRLRDVQRWVMSVLTATTIGHLAVGLAVGGVLIDADQPQARIGLAVIGAAFGMMAVAAGFAIHQRPPLTSWLLVGALPGVVALVLVLR